MSLGETLMAHCSIKDTGITVSQLSWWYVVSSYEELKQGRHKVKTSAETFTCPYCPERKHDYKYNELLNHATGVGRSSSDKRSAKEKGSHLALVKYLEEDLPSKDSPSKPVDQGDLFVNEVTIKKILLIFLFSLLFHICTNLLFHKGDEHLFGFTFASCFSYPETLLM